MCWHADMKATFGEKRHELNVSTYQMVILLLFNEADRLSYSDILHATSIPPGDLKRSLQSLACVKVGPSPLFFPRLSICSILVSSEQPLEQHLPLRPLSSYFPVRVVVDIQFMLCVYFVEGEAPGSSHSHSRLQDP